MCLRWQIWQIFYNNIDASSSRFDASSFQIIFIFSSYQYQADISIAAIKEKHFAFEIPTPLASEIPVRITYSHNSVTTHPLYANPLIFILPDWIHTGYFQLYSDIYFCCIAMLSLRLTVFYFSHIEKVYQKP